MSRIARAAADTFDARPALGGSSSTLVREVPKDYGSGDSVRYIQISSVGHGSHQFLCWVSKTCQASDRADEAKSRLRFAGVIRVVLRGSERKECLGIQTLRW